MPLSRKQFVSAAAIGVSAAAIGLEPAAAGAAPARTPVHFHILTPSQYNRAAMMRALNSGGANKQVFQSVDPILVAPGIASLYMHMQNSMNAYQFSLGTGKLSTLGVILGSSIVLALNDNVWKKYSFGKAFKLGNTNAYYAASSNLNLGASADDPNGVYQDWSAQAVMARGGKFFVCHNAMTGIAAVLSSKMPGTAPAGVLADFEKNILPGFIVVPAGVAAIQQAQESGWKPFPII
jgi:intracellular sulfur oxidation DsrE/DsrF family protein